MSGKFILFGSDRKTLGVIKSTLASNGHIYLGYSSGYSSILRHVRSYAPDVVFIEESGNIGELRRSLEVVDEDLLAACILILDAKNPEIESFFGKTRATGYIYKPVFPEAVLQLTELTLVNYRRVAEYDRRLKELNDTLETKKLVEKSKWLLMEREGLSEAQAYEEIQKKSRSTGNSMKCAAQAIILTYP